MNYYHHLVKINNLNNNGSRLSLLRLVVIYNLRYLLWRPSVVKLFGATICQPEKKLFYTVLTGGYDRLNELPEKLPNWDYICFTDNPEVSSDSWEIRTIDHKSGLDPVRLSRHFKINNHLVDQGYGLSVYVDANIRIRGNLDTFLSHALPIGSSCAVLLHPFLHSLKQEAQQCIAVGKDSGELVQKQYEYYTSEMGFDDRFPHINARMLIRRSGSPAIQQLMETWFEQLLNWSRRDQLAFNYALSQCPGVTPDYIPYWKFRPYFKRIDHS